MHLVMSTSEISNVLLTGGSGLIASHILNSLLDHGFKVVVTTRSHEKGHQMIKSIGPRHENNVQYSIVEDITRDGAFDNVLKNHPEIEYAVHNASPYYLGVKEDPIREFLDPAIKGTTGLLRSIKANAPRVKRVVVTSSSAAILNTENHAKVYDESHWAPYSWDDAKDPQKTYKTSKVLAEKAAWAFMSEEKPNFELTVINNTYTFGPIQRGLPSLEAVNTSNHFIRDMVEGKMRNALPPTAPVFTFVDVRDVALAHSRSLTAPEAGGKRIYVVAGHFSTKRIADIIRESYPHLSPILPPVDAEDDLPDDVYEFDNRRSRDILGLEYRSLEQSVADTAASILDWIDRHK